MDTSLAGLKLTQKVALVTGASSGIGSATALLLSSRGASVAVNFIRNKRGAQEVVGKIREAGGTAFAVQADVSDKQDVHRLVSTVAEALGPIDILVNNAGMKTVTGDFMDYGIDVWDAHYRVNVRSAVLVCRAVLPGMVERGWGRIVNVSSKAARLGKPHNAIYYSASKAALDALTIGLGIELAGSGVLVNGVAPGITDTPLHNADRGWFERGSAGVPMRRAATPNEVAEVIAFLASPANSYMVGEVVTVAGGR